MSAIQQLLTDHIDIWTAADTAKKSGRGRSSGNAASVYGIKKLRELILELAVRGKLVPQDANDEPASELLKRIEAEKAKLIAEGKIKKDKSLPPITDDEKSYELPKNWECVRLQEVFDVRDGTHDTPKYCDNGFPLITSKNLYSGVLDFSNIKYISEEDYLKIKERSGVDKGDILFAMIGSIGNPVIVETDNDFSIKNVALFKPYSHQHCDMYYLLKYLLKASVDMREQASGAVQSFVSLGVIRNYVFYMPPLAEQHRIVAKVDELMALCDQLENQHSNAAEAHEKLVSYLLGTLTQSQSTEDFNTNWQRIAAHFGTLFTTEASIEALKQTLLQLAVMGKLVQQDPNDEPASELLKRIQAEKTKLIAEGKIKKAKPLAPITDEEKLFILPKEWGWVRLEDLMPEFQNGASSRGDSDGDPVIVLRLADIKDRHISLDEPRELLISPSMIEKYRLSLGDILVVRVNGSADLVGGFVVCEQSFNGIYCDHFIRMRIPQNTLIPRFLSLVGASQLVRNRIQELFITTAGQKTVNQSHISSLIMPLLSVTEQHRIVAKVDELMAICDQLKSRLTEANQLQQKLADVLVEQATA